MNLVRRERESGRGFRCVSTGLRLAVPDRTDDVDSNRDWLMLHDWIDLHSIELCPEVGLADHRSNDPTDINLDSTANYPARLHPTIKIGLVDPDHRSGSTGHRL